MKECFEKLGSLEVQLRLSVCVCWSLFICLLFYYVHPTKFSAPGLSSMNRLSLNSRCLAELTSMLHRAGSHITIDKQTLLTLPLDWKWCNQSVCEWFHVSFKSIRGLTAFSFDWSCRGGVRGWSLSVKALAPAAGGWIVCKWLQCLPWESLELMVWVVHFATLTLGLTTTWSGLWIKNITLG